MVSAINGALEEDFQIKRPMKLKVLKGRFSQGQDIMGRGFELTAQERAGILSADPSCEEVIFPLFNGQDLNTMPRLEPYRWVIYFRDWPEETARQYGAAFRRVEELVKPYRESLTGQIHQDCYWKFWDLRPQLIFELDARTTVLASAINSKYVSFRRVPTGNVYNKKTKLYFIDTWWEFAVLQSSFHQEWAYWTCGTLGASTINYSTSAALETWPMPKEHQHAVAGLERLGEEYHALREQVLLQYEFGLTKLYNRFHDPSDDDSRTELMRNLHREIDLAVACAYGWDDLDLGHGFHEVPYLPQTDRVRFTISDAARVEVLRRLSGLNHQRYEEEVAQGLHGRGTPRAASRTSRAVRSAQSSFDFKAGTAATANGVSPAPVILGFLTSHEGWHAKAEILAATGIKGGQWSATIADLIASGRVERQGERRGARY